MRYTNEQYEQLVNQGKQIESFIRSEICPYLEKEITVEFGDVVTRGRFGNIKEFEFDLTVRKDNIIGGCGGLSLYFDIPSYFKGLTGCIEIYEDKGYGANFLYYLLLNWNNGKCIKNKLVDKEENMLKVIPAEQQNKFKCHFCGYTRSVKYIIATNESKPTEVPCCNRCALLREVLIEKQNGGDNQCL